MYFILELLFGIFQGLAYWGRIERREEPKPSIINRYVAVAYVLALLLVVILIYFNNPDLHTTKGGNV